MIRGIKNILVVVLVIGLSTEAVVNILMQFNTLTEAKRLNSEYKIEITQINKENIQLLAKITYATSSAYVQQQARDLFGLGAKNDYWLILPKDTNNIDLVPKVNVAEDKPYWKQWWELFTR